MNFKTMVGKLSVKGQAVNILGFEGHTLCHNCSAPHYSTKQPYNTKQVNKRSSSNKTLLVN